MKRIAPANRAGSAYVFAENVLFHYFNPRLQDLQRDYPRLTELHGFFEKIRNLTKGTLAVTPITITPVGNELVVVHSKNTMALEDETIETDVVVVWRFLDERITEVGAIPSVHCGQVSQE